MLTLAQTFRPPTHQHQHLFNPNLTQTLCTQKLTHQNFHSSHLPKNPNTFLHLRTTISIPKAAVDAPAPNPDDHFHLDVESYESSDFEKEKEKEESTAGKKAAPSQPCSGPQLGLRRTCKRSMGKLELAGVFGLWYFQNIVFNIYNRKVLDVFPYPWLLASSQLLVGSLLTSALWGLRLRPRPRASRRFLSALLAPALFHAVGHISACVSFSRSAASSAHVVKSAEPALSVFISALHQRFYPLHVWLAVIPVIVGCALATATDAPFTAAGLYGALISNVGFVLRNIYSKEALRVFKHVDGVNLYGSISIVAMCYLFPAAVLIEGGRWAVGVRAAVAATATAPWRFYGWVAVSGVFYHLYNLTSYRALDEISPLTFSVGNTMKRVVVIAASVAVFRNPVRPLNAIGSAVAVLGSFFYSQATAASGKSKK